MTPNWLPSIGDPTLFGWFIVLGYLAAAALCITAARVSSPTGSGERRFDRRFWLGVSVLFLFLAINKQLDFQTLINDVVRDIAKAQGWYGRRDAVQALFVAALATGCGALLLGLLWLSRATPPTVKLALLGLTVLGAFVVLRSTLFHRVETLVELGIPAGLWSALLEPLGIAIVTIAAATYGAQRRRIRNRAQPAPFASQSSSHLIE